MLWQRTERAARAAEMYALKVLPQERFEAQLLILLSALGPLVVYGATLDVYAQRPRLTPNPALFATRKQRGLGLLVLGCCELCRS